MSRKYWYTFRWSIHKIECSLIEMHKIVFYMTLNAQQPKQREEKKGLHFFGKGKNCDKRMNRETRGRVLKIKIKF